MDDAFIDESSLPIHVIAAGYDSSEAVLQAVKTTPFLAVVDNNMIQGNGFGFDEGQFYLEGVEPGDTTMQPTEIEIGNPETGELFTVTVIGVIDAQVSTFYGVLMSRASYDELGLSPSYIEHVIRAAPGADTEQLAREIEPALITYGVQATTCQELIDEMSGVSIGFLRIIEGFMLLGLVVGIAALGVLSFRSVVERRQQIGMLRVIGYRRSMVSASFLIEALMITVLGVLSGVILGLALGWQLVTSEYFIGTASSVEFVIRWIDVIVFVGISLVASLLMAFIPAQRASRVPIAAALRYE